MLKRLYIDNFRCFVNFEYKPERKQLLLGANGSGKSSLLDALRLLKGFLCDEKLETIKAAFFRGRTRWLEAQNQVFEIEAELGGDLYIYRLELQHERVPSWFEVGALKDRVGVLAESLKVNGMPIAEILDGQAILYPRNPENSVKRQQQMRIPDGSILGSLGGQREEVKIFVRWISDLPCLDLNPYAMERPTPLVGRPRLASDLSNIGDWFAQYKLDETHRKSVEQLSASLQEVLDGFISIEAKEPVLDDPEDDVQRTDEATLSGSEKEQQARKPLELQVTFERTGAIVPLWFHELSEGQRCLIAIYMILHFLIEKGHTVFLDEPDNFISLREIQPWLLQAEAAADDSKGQLILISHHPEILNQWAHEYGMRMFRADGGPVQIEKFKTDYDDLMRPSEVVARGWEND